ncbi:MAG: FkbM family methyltransferase [Caulobacteraceae bacterium]
MKLTPRQRASWVAHLYKAATRQHHRDLAPMFAPHVPAEAIVLDVGAHAGQFAKLFARMAPRGHVYAFEPSEYARSILGRALAFNRVGNVTVVPRGLSDAPARAVLHTPLKRSSAWGFGTAHLGEAAAGEADQTVALERLDDFAAREGLYRLDFIKADIEGWEMRALAGGEGTLRRFRPALYLEVDDALLARAGDTPRALFAWLTDIGYRAFETPSLAPVSSWSEPGDFLFVAGERP